MTSSVRLESPGPGQALREPVRFHHLDAARAFALLLGVFFHAAESFGPHNTYWAIVDCSPSQLLEDVRFACHAFRLEMFFVMSGFFARLLLERRGVRPFVANRTRRILVPLVIGWCVLFPVLVLIWLWGQAASGRLGELGIPPEAQNLPLIVLWMAFFLKGVFIEKFDLTHVWFLHQLLVLYGLFLGLRALQQKLDPSGRVMTRLDGWFGRMAASPFGWFGFSLLAFPLLLTMNSWGVDTPKESLLPQVPSTLLFGFCFFCGWLWHRQPDLLQKLDHRWMPHLALGVLLWIGIGLFDRLGLRRLDPISARLLFTLLYAHMMWAFVMGFIGLFGRFFRQPRRWVRYLADGSYWIYLAHLPLVVTLQVALGRVPLPWPIKYVVIVVVSMTLLLLSYHYLARSTFIGVQLNGRKYPRQWPWQGTGSPETEPR